MKRSLIALVLLAACNVGPSGTPSQSAAPSVTPVASESSAPPSTSPAASGSCAPTDQDAYVYHPARLALLAPCIRVTGTVAAVRKEADGDDHVLIALDPAYANLVNAANAGQELGDLVVEPVCELPVTQSDAIAICATDHTQTVITGLVVGIHVWVEGRYVTDSDHGGWAELHPLYRWGVQPGAGVALSSLTPALITENEAP